MARNTSITTVLAPEPKVNEAAMTLLDAAPRELALVQAQHDSAVRAVALQMGYQLPADCTDPDLIQRDISANMRRSVEACLEVGRGLTVLKTACGHGNFTARLDVLGIEERVAQKFMGTARKFSKAASTPLLAAAGNQTKLFEMLLLDDDQIEELELTGQTGELKLDDVATMSVKELRAALRQANQDNTFMAEKRSKAEQRADTAEKKLAGKRPVIVPLDERITPFMVEITERQSLGEKIVVAHLEAAAALDAWWLDEVTQQEGYDPEQAAPMPRSVGMVVAHLFDSAERLAALVGRLQHELDERFGADIAEARQYLMQEPQEPPLPEAGDAAA